MGGGKSPSQPGQIVEYKGKLGVTTDYPRIKSDRIPVMFVGGDYPVLIDVSELIVASSL